jgi:hypothetical protein
MDILLKYWLCGHEGGDKECIQDILTESLEEHPAGRPEMRSEDDSKVERESTEVQSVRQDERVHVNTASHT